MGDGFSGLPDGFFGMSRVDSGISRFSLSPFFGRSQLFL
jgi:hypothetical protein